MKTAFIGAGEISVETAKALVQKGHEVVILGFERVVTSNSRAFATSWA